MQEASAELDILNQKLEVQKKVVAEKQAASNVLLSQVREGGSMIIKNKILLLSEGLCIFFYSSVYSN